MIKLSTFLNKHKWLFYLLSYTWALVPTLVGWLVYGFANVFLRKKIYARGRFETARYLVLGDNWGGLELGTNFIVAGNMSMLTTLHIKQHELGHTYQNAIIGNLVIFIIFIPSVIRYWYQTIRKRKGLINKPYDSIWFEGQATRIGEAIYYGKKPV